jgi:beta-lactam-binding protein with PASTA domain
MKKYFTFFISKVLYINIGIIIGVTIIGFIVFKTWLSSYTNHGEYITVPDFSNLDFDAAQIVAKEHNLQLVIIDTVYSKEIKPGAIVNHKPAANSHVKEYRTIYVSINSHTPILVKMPNASNVSLRQATQVLESAGLYVGNIIYKPDFADNYVFEQRYGNRVIPTGAKIPKGSKVDLVVGKGGSTELIDIPNFIGYSYKEVLDSATVKGVIVNCMFSQEVYASYQDSLMAKVWKQSPAYNQNAKIMTGQIVDVWLNKGE